MTNIYYKALLSQQHAPVANDTPNAESFYKGTFYVNNQTITQQPPTAAASYDMDSSLLIPTKFHKWTFNTKTKTTVVSAVEVFADTEETPTACVFFDGKTNAVGVYDYGLNDKTRQRRAEMMKRVERSPNLACKTTMRLVLLEVYPSLKGNSTNKAHLYPLTDYKNGLARIFTDKAQCLKAIRAYKTRNDKNESLRFRQLIETIEWYPKTLELLALPEDIKERAVLKHKANKENRALVTKMKKYVNDAYRFFEVAKYERDEQEEIDKVLSDGYGDLVTPEKLDNARKDGTGLLGLATTDSGASVFRPAKQIVGSRFTFRQSLHYCLGARWLWPMEEPHGG